MNSAPLSSLAPEASSGKTSCKKVDTAPYTSAPAVKKPEVPVAMIKETKVTPQVKMEESTLTVIPETNCQSQDPTNFSYNYGWGWLGALILWFIVFIVLFWLIYYSLAPSFVLQNNSDQIDTAKVLLGAVISALIVIIIIWLIRAAIGYSYKKKMVTSSAPSVSSPETVKAVIITN